MAKLWLHQSDSYEINTEVYSGPLDLLLDLIQKAELDISKLALAQVTDQFLDFIEKNKDADPDYLSEFLIIAARLVQIKSEALLPRPPVRGEDEEDLGETLARQLIVYREIKKTTEWLTKRINDNLRSHLHIPRTYPVNVQLDLEGVSIDDLIYALENLASQQPVLQNGALISIPKITLKKKVEDILHILRADHKSTFSKILGDSDDRLQAIVVFLAILELVKQRLITTEQDTNFGDITLLPEAELFDSDETEIQIDEL
ncbi:MAG: segregation/condensation protein A [Anaerolineaceae bacterium]|mgnify:CR=1 FL=1|jgi:segregation and condensation protein A|nr:segregation/condensation protein A [Anaerolineaceae bacterium]MDD4041929.1 segregation/condensation protein A [Anaerolineaceae bacterium]